MFILLFLLLMAIFPELKTVLANRRCSINAHGRKANIRERREGVRKEGILPQESVASSGGHLVVGHL